MKNQDFDNYFKNNADERSFDFDESFWGEMEILIDEQDDSTVAASIFNWKNLWLGGLILFITGSSVLFFKADRLPTSNSTTDENKTSSSVVTEPTNNPIILNKKGEKTIKENTTKSEKNKNNNTNSQPIAAKSNVKKKDNKKESKSKTNNILKRNKTSKKAEQKIVNKVNRNSMNDDTFVKENSPNQIRNGEPNQQKVSPPLMLVTSEEGSQPNNISRKNQSAQSNLDKSKNATIATNLSDANTIEEWVYLTSSIRPLSTEIPTLEDLSLFSPQSERGNNSQSAKVKVQLGLIAGTHLYQGYKNMGEQRVPLSNDYFGGIYVNTTFNKKWSGRIGMNYWQRDALNSVISADSTVYGFGATVYSKMVNLHHTQSVELPILVAYHMRKSNLTGGIQMNYLFNAKGTYSETVSDAFSSVSRGEVTQNGYQTAFNQFNLGMSLGYEYLIQQNLRLGAQVQVDFLDVTNNTVFNNTTTDRNVMLKVYAAYDLWAFNKK